MLHLLSTYPYTTANLLLFETNLYRIINNILIHVHINIKIKFLLYNYYNISILYFNNVYNFLFNRLKTCIIFKELNIYIKSIK